MHDASLAQSLVLPAGALTTTSSPIDLGEGYKADGVELRFDAPAIPLAQLANTETVTYSLELSDTSVFTTVQRTVSLGVQTGATANASCAAISNRRYRPASNDWRYARIKAVKTGATSAAASSATLNVDNQ